MSPCSFTKIEGDQPIFDQDERVWEANFLGFKEIGQRL
jgi:hypothetical protein